MYGHDILATLTEKLNANKLNLYQMGYKHNCLGISTVLLLMLLSWNAQRTTHFIPGKL